MSSVGLLKSPLLSEPQWLRVDSRGMVGKVDRDKGIIFGGILAEETVFKDKRGEFDRRGIRQISAMAKLRTTGLKSRLAHPSASSDSIGKFLGRWKDPRTDTVLREVGQDADGKPLMQERMVTRADLHLDKTALEEPIGGGKPLGVYIMDLAESDPDAFGASLVLKRREEYRLDKNNRRLTDENGEELPPLWFPTELHAADIVDDGDATHSFLSADILAGLPDAIVRQGCELLDAQFEGQDRDVIKARLSAFVDRYLNHRFGEPEESDEEPTEEPIVPVPCDDALVLELWLAGEEAA